MDPPERIENGKVMERVLGPEHPDTLTSRNNLASGYRDLGRYEEAVALHVTANRQSAR